jgi:hypothetical protein
MNQELRHHYKCNRWDGSGKAGLLEYLRAENCYQSISGNPNANPYWWGAILDFNTFDKIIDKLIVDKSVSLGKLRKIFEHCRDDINSPIVRLTGFGGLRKVEKHEILRK